MLEPPSGGDYSASDYDGALDMFNALPATAPDSVLREAYERDVFPIARSRVRATAFPRADLLILTAGGQPYSIALSLEASPADEVAFLCTADSQPSAERAAGWVLRPDVRRRYERVDKADALSVYAAVRAVYEPIRDDGAPSSRVIVDITSGTKAMTAAASSAAVVIDAEQRYVESNPTRHRGFFAREKVHRVAHPLAVFGDLRRREGERLFNELALEHAASIFRELDQQGAPDYRYRERALLAEAYAEVDRLRFGEAATRLEGTLLRLEHAPLCRDPLCVQADRIARQRDVLRELSAEIPPAPLLVRFLLAYARRRERQGLYDAAALVHYRAVEFAIQLRLAGRGISAEDATPAAYADAAIAAGIADLVGAYNTEAGPQLAIPTLSTRVGLAQGWLLLRAFGDALTEGVSTQILLRQTEARNHSIFAHGRRPLEPASYARFAETARSVCEKLASIEGWSLPVPDDELEFVSIPPS